ncbi:CRISPR-associated helicase Cas3' [Alteromonas sp. a30]|uniref:CRISPR-associated helicase Cas3' n=1 Tax=Alteromonas sp. a30 TaxID=2730917 RepID=UPI00228082F3|nr:CRISPR-associated helicase Cas3' [Alteromonas sp. a30]MCY7295734.1 CRISPR-associated helicase Cas3' [Alteromonas sp. a30]
MKEYVAHINKQGNVQYLKDHLSETSYFSAQFANKIGLKNAGLILGLLHDFGKYAQKFQSYINSAEGRINPDEDEWVDSGKLKGKVDHSTAGAQYLYQKLSQLAQNKGYGELVGQMLGICIASHHSGLINIIGMDNTLTFFKRINKIDDDTHLQECIEKADAEILQVADKLLSVDLIKEVIGFTNQFNAHFGELGKPYKSQQAQFHLGFLTRFLFSCLIDADRLNSAEFEEPERKEQREQNTQPVDWTRPINALEAFIAKFSDQEHYVNKIRAEISEQCLNHASKPQGLYTLTVPTGGGKTYASLRYALHHAKTHLLDRIIFVIPYTSIIEQNAQAIRKAFEDDAELQSWVLEHHSNLEPDKQTWHSKLVSENWDSPIVLTTSVQLLEAMFAGGTKSARRLHQLAKSVVIFDEAQTLPIKCTHMFCNAINFLTHYCQTTVVLCTATQPGLNELKRSERGMLALSEHSEIIGDYQRYYQQLQRVEIHNECKAGGWSLEELTELATQQFAQEGSCLVIVNTKNWAKNLYNACAEQVDSGALFHLSTNQYPIHRKALLEEIKTRLANKLPVLCISTQLIEAGVDVDFASAIRFLAGLDSIAQAAGRCNRSGKLKDANGIQRKGNVFIVNPFKEKTDLLPDIEAGKEKALSVLNAGYDDPLCPAAIKQYFKEYYYNRSNDMAYPIGDKTSMDNLLDLLSNRKRCLVPDSREKHKKVPLMRHAFMDAGKQFEAIDAPTRALIIEHGKGVEIISELLSVAKEFNATRFYELLRSAQQYSVNVFPNVWKQLEQENAIEEIQGEGIFYLTERYYHEAFGLSTEVVGKMSDFSL